MRSLGQRAGRPGQVLRVQLLLQLDPEPESHSFILELEVGLDYFRHWQAKQFSTFKLLDTLDLEPQKNYGWSLCDLSVGSNKLPTMGIQGDFRFV